MELTIYEQNHILSKLEDKKSDNLNFYLIFQLM